jgi:dienelactone hydrolase
MRLLPTAVIACMCATPLAASETVEIQHGEGVLNAIVFRPSGDGPFAAIVGLHGCAGLKDRSGALKPLYQDWGERLAAAGYAVIFPDSFGSRGIESQCRVRQQRVRARRERVADANAAREWLQAQSWVRADRVALVGWSNGGTTALWAVRARTGALDHARDFRSAVAFYPGCRRAGEAAWSARVPTLVLIGTADDWTPASACQTMIAGARGRSARTQIVTYPGAHHAFDHPNLPLRERTGLAFTADGSGKAHVGTDPTARQDSIRRVTEWLAR